MSRKKFKPKQQPVHGEDASRQQPKKRMALWKILVPAFVFLFLLHCRMWYIEEEMLIHTAFSSGSYLELNRKDGYDGSFRIGAYQGTSVKYYNYDFKTFELLDNSVNKVVFDNQAASSSTSGFTDKDLYSIKKNKNTKAVYDAFFSGDGFVVIRDSDTVYWIRSLKDPNVWMKLEED